MSWIVLFDIPNIDKWTRRDLNPGPLPCQGSDLPLIYEPIHNQIRSLGINLSEGDGPRIRLSDEGGITLSPVSLTAGD